jgi:hypothetical protein
VLTIVRYDTNHGEIEIFMPIKAPTRLMCEKIYTDTVTEDKDYLVKDYDDIDYVDDNFEYSYRIDEYEDLLVIKKHPIDIVQNTEHHPSFING